MNTKELKIVYSGAHIRREVKKLAEKICRDYTDDAPVLAVCVLKGAVMFFTELVKRMTDKDVKLDFITLSSYAGASTSGKVNLVKGLSESAEGRHLLFVEDIIDSGYTVEYLRSAFTGTGAKDVKVVCLLDKPAGRKTDAAADYTVFTLKNDAFIVGCGLDFDQSYRNLDGIYELTGAKE